MRSVFLFISCAFFLAAATYLGQLLLTGQVSDIETNSNPTEILVNIPSAKKRLIAGDILYLSDVVWVSRPAFEDKNKMQVPAKFTKNSEYFAVSKNIEAGALIEENAILWPSDLNFLPNILKEEFRAMGVFFDSENSILPMLWPGSRIDLVLILDPDKKRIFSDEVTVKLIAENIRVLSNSSFSNAKNKESDLSKRKSALNLILEVSPDQSEIISLARGIGSLVPVFAQLGLR